MEPEPESEPGRLNAAAGRQLQRLRDFVDDTSTGALATLAVITLSLAAAFVGFLLVSSLTVAPFAVFLVASGYGWVRYQEETALALTLATTVSTLLILGLIIVFIFIEAVPVFQYESATVFGVSVPALRMFTQPNWDAVSAPIRYSMVPMIHGTVMVTVIATVVAAPLGVSARSSASTSSTTMTTPQQLRDQKLPMRLKRFGPHPASINDVSRSVATGIVARFAASMDSVAGRMMTVAGRGVPVRSIAAERCNRAT